MTIPIKPPRETQLAIIQLAAKKKISELYATQYALNFGLYQLQMIPQDVYERYEKQWSTSLVPEPIPKKLSVEELQRQQKQQELTRHFRLVLDQWDLQKDDFSWVVKTVEYAKKYTLEYSDAVKIVERGEAIMHNHVLFAKVGSQTK